MKKTLLSLALCMLCVVVYGTTWYRTADPINVGEMTVLYGLESSNSNTTTTNSWSCNSSIVSLSKKQNGLVCEVTGLSAGTAEVKCTVTSYNPTSGTSYNYLIYTVTVNEVPLDPGTWSGNTLTIGGNATDSDYDVPYNNWYRYSTVQALYTPKEIGKSGTINSIAFKVANANSFPTSEVKVYLGHKSGIFTSESDYVKSSNLTLVYDGKPTLGQSTGWETLTFNKGSFTYNGTDNLVVVVTRKSDNYTGSLKYYYYTGSGFTLYRRSDSDAGYGEVTNTYSYTKSTDRPTIRMVFATSQGTATGDIAINETNFPDANFRSFLLSQSYGQDGVLTGSEIAGVKSIDVGYKSISTLKGIEHFTELTNLSCYGNYLTSLDVSRNTALTNLNCYGNYLTSLDVSKNTALTNLNCSADQLTSLDVSKNMALTQLYCNNNQLTSLDVSKNTALTVLYCYNNQLTFLDVSKNTALTTLECDRNQLTALDVSKNTALTTLECDRNQLTALDVTKNTALTRLDCYSNQLAALDVSKNIALTNLSCHDNQLTSLDVSKNTALIWLYCHSNQLTSLDVSKNTALKLLNFTGNKIKGTNMDNLINSLRQNNTTSTYNFYVIDNSNGDEGNVCTKSQVAAVKAKGWTPNYYNGTSWVEYEGSEDNNAIVINGLYYAIITSNDINDAINEDDGLIGVFTSNTDVAVVTSAPKGSEYTGAIKIPSSIELNGITYAVEALTADAFEGTSITSVLLPNSMRLIAAGAFQNCIGLTNITIPSSVKCICEDAFSGCTGLTSIISEIEEPFPVKSSVFKNVTAILYVPYGTKAKYDATDGWNQLTITEMEPAGLQDGDTFTEAGITYQVISASEKTAQLKRGADVSGVVNIPSEVNGFTVKAIGKAAFRELRNITVVTIPNSVITMERSVFDDCSNLTSVSIPGSVTSIGVRLFTSCKKLTSVTVANDNPVYDSRNNCNAIIETATNKLIVGSIASVIPESVVTIGPRAFEEIGGMVNVVIPEGVTGIEELAFVDCSDLKEVTLPSTLTSISMDAFGECPSITKVVCLITNPFAIDKWTFGIEDTNYAGYFNPVVYNTATLYVPAGTSALYQATDGWNLFANIEELDEGLKDGDEFASNVTESLTLWLKVISAENKTCEVIGLSDRKWAGALTIPATIDLFGYTVTAIGRQAFCYFDNLTSITIPNTVTTIGDEAFKSKHSLIVLDLQV